jgi:mono/diheme cytochrome c family protein
MKLIVRRIETIFVTIFIISLSGCFRGLPSDKPPIHIINDMADQPKYKPESVGAFFPDSSAMRQPVPGTIARGELRADSAYYLGANGNGDYIAESPVPVTLKLLQRGQERFNIYCSPCHSRLGDGKGIVVTRGYLPPPSFHTDRVRQFPDGQIFDAISNGVRNMPSYGNQVRVVDRWAIVAYVRALQRSQNASIIDIPDEMKGKIK